MKSPNTATLTRYDRRARHSDDRISPFKREIHSRLLDRVTMRAWSQILAVECADGWVAEEVWRRIMRGYVCGVDISPAMIELANAMRRVDGQLEFEVWDGSRLPFHSGSFDLALSTFGFHRYPDPVRVLQEIRRVLSPGGRVWLAEPDRRAFGGFFTLVDHYFRLTDPGHVRYYDVSSLVELLERAGFQDVRVVERYQRLLRGGKLFGTAVFIEGTAGAGGD